MKMFPSFCYGLLKVVLLAQVCSGERVALKDAFKDHFLIGTAVNRSIVTGQAGFRRSADLAAADVALVKEHFNQIVAENDMKWMMLHPRPGEKGYTFEAADALVEFGEANGMEIAGHTLVWHSQTPNWVFEGEHLPPGVKPPEEGSPEQQPRGERPRRGPGRFGTFNLNGPRASREELLERMRDHIHTVVGRYKGKIKVWDVVNEAISDGGDEILRKSPWSEIIGPDFINKAFEYAHEADPDAILRYNDYGLENPQKRAKLIRLITSLKEHGVPVMAVGSQAHLNVSSNFEMMDQCLTEMATLGLPIHITELDINGAVRGQRGTGADIAESADAASGGLVDEANRKLAEAYEGVFKAFVKHRNSIEMVTFWGANDALSWRRGGNPLLFDGNNQPKAAFDAVIKVASEETASTVDENFHIYLCFGQSNMEGFPGIEDEDKKGVDERFQMLAAVDFPDLNREKGHWYPAVPPLCRPRAGIGPADYFGRTLVSRLPKEVRVGVVNVSVAGCKIELFGEETREAYVAEAPGWMKGIIAAYDGDPYVHLVEMGKRAQRDGVIKGILLHQGESNNNDKEWPNKVKVIYERLLKDLDLNPRDVPLLAGELVPEDQGGACASMNAIIRTLPEVIPTAHVVPSKGCESRGDHLHFTPAGYRELGKRYAMTMLPLLGIKDEPRREEPKKEKTPQTIPILPALPKADDTSFYSEKEVPHGKVEIVQYKSLSGDEKRMHVYTPPGYKANGDQRYPVLYLNHGGGENDSHWTANGFANRILDNLIAEGKARPMIVAMPNTGGLVTGQPPKSGEDDACSEEYLKAILPFIDGRYRTQTDRESRAVAGLSMGGFVTLNTGLTHLETFGELYVYSSGYWPDKLPAFKENIQPLLSSKGINEKFRMPIYFGVGETDIAYLNSMKTLAVFNEHGIRNFSVLSSHGHEWLNWRRYLYQSAQMMFQAQN